MSASGSNPPRDIQPTVFYTRDWTKAIDKHFMGGLLREALVGNYKEGSTSNGNAIRKLMNEVNNVFNVNFDYKFYYERTRRLRQRYLVFKKIISLSGVYFNEETNAIEYEPSVWDHISKVERLALAYRVQGEPQFDTLRRIFEVEDDSVGFQTLEPIMQLSSGMDSLSIHPTVQLAPVQVAHDSSFWNALAGHSSDTESDGGTGV